VLFNAERIIIMKKRIRTLLVVAASMLLIISMLTGCGPKKPTADDAKAYAQAVIDLICTGDYDHSVKLADVEEGNEGAMRDMIVEEFVNQVNAQVSLDDDANTAVREFITTALGKCKYTIGEAVPTDDGGFDVTVTVEPLKVIPDGFAQEFQAGLPGNLGVEADVLAGMTQQEINNLVFKVMFNALTEKLSEPQYDAPQDVVLHYGLIDEENKIYGMDESQGEKLGSVLFSTEGL
jgi:hypothetical protein